MWRSLHAEIRALITYLRADVDMDQIVDAHLPILAALRRRDPELAGKEMRHHIEYFGALAVGPPCTPLHREVWSQ